MKFVDDDDDDDVRKTEWPSAGPIHPTSSVGCIGLAGSEFKSRRDLTFFYLYLRGRQHAVQR